MPILVLEVGECDLLAGLTLSPEDFVYRILLFFHLKRVLYSDEKSQSVS